MGEEKEVEGVEKEEEEVGRGEKEALLNPSLGSTEKWIGEGT